MGNLEIVQDEFGQPFIHQGKKYYQFKNGGEKLTQSRLFAFQDVMEESNRFVVKKEELLNSLNILAGFFQRIIVNSSNPEQIINLATQGGFKIEGLKGRINIGVAAEMVLDVSAIWFITEAEDPETNDVSINKEKVDSWRPYPELTDFFLRLAGVVWNAFPTLLDTSFLSSIVDLNLAEMLQTKLMLAMPEYYGISAEQAISLKLRMEILKQRNDLCDYLHTISTNLSELRSSEEQSSES
ncbi:hypothetical protein ACFFJX_12715 [Pseudarcicella hirudinis]|uniref:hypothetical protein n=1 Tax=Pseudarcicella hirudinis TaxID=1079859 RepID=UPI0035EBEE72